MTILVQYSFMIILCISAFPPAPLSTVDYTRYPPPSPAFNYASVPPPASVAPPTQYRSAPGAHDYNSTQAMFQQLSLSPYASNAYHAAF